MAYDNAFERGNHGAPVFNDLGKLEMALAQRDALVKALEGCRTAYCGYVITDSDQYPEVLARFWKEIQRIDGIARAALDAAAAPVPRPHKGSADA